jgi:lipopolysaccharide/colanic/teichoic acid biosynthesis glycosyltransferase
VKYYTPEQRRVLQVKPGMTGPTQVMYRHEEDLLNRCANLEEDYVKRIMPQKLALDLQYIEHQSLSLDVKLIIQTFLCLFKATDLASEQSATVLSTPGG